MTTSSKTKTPPDTCRDTHGNPGRQVTCQRDHGHDGEHGNLTEAEAATYAADHADYDRDITEADQRGGDLSAVVRPQAPAGTTRWR